MPSQYIRSDSDLAKIDALKPGDAHHSEVLDAKSKNHQWSVFRYANSYIFFTETLLSSPGQPVLGYEVDRSNLELLFDGKAFTTLNLIPMEPI